jgi:hypothetical protein
MPAPTLVSATFSRTTQNRVLVQYSINVNTTDAQTNGNYSFSGGSLAVSSVSYNSSTFIATITTTGQANGTGYTVTVSNVKDAATGTFTIGSPTNTFAFRQSDLLKTLAAPATVMSLSHIVRAVKTDFQPFAGTGSSAGGTTVVRQTSGFNQGTN